MSAPTVTTVPPMLDGFAAMHAAMRRDIARLPAAVATADPSAAAALVHWYSRFNHTIEVHHTREDDLVWPRLAARSASFTAARPRLERDHEQLDTALADVARSVADLARHGRESDRADALRAVEVLGEVLVDHLAREEDAAFAEIERCFAEDEWTALEEELMRRTPVRALAFEAPWSLLTMDQATQEDKIAGAPAPLRLLYRWAFLPRYQRLVRAAGM